jgi:NADP-dependent 3-hydroxy acid dehydrogenase YdfG
LVVDSNLKGVWNTIQVTAPHLIATGGGSIVTTSSAAGIRGQVPYAHYVSSKHEVVGLMKAVANALAPQRIRGRRRNGDTKGTNTATGRVIAVDRITLAPGSTPWSSSDGPLFKAMG